MRAARRKIRFLAPVAMALLVVVSASACSSAGTYAARVDGRSISEDDLLDELRAIASNARYLEQLEAEQPVLGSGQGTFDSTFTASLLTRQIYYLLISAELGKRDLAVSQKQLDDAREAVAVQLEGEEILSNFSTEYQAELVARQAEIDLLAIASSGVGTPDTAERIYFDEHPEEFQTACATHILVADEAKALDLGKRLAEGADFAELARTESTDTGTAAQGGEVGCDIGRSSPLVTPFLDAVFTQPVGEVGPPVRTSFGVHLIKVTSRQTPPFEETQLSIRETLIELGGANLREMLRAQVRESKIDINPKYGTFEKTDESLGVVPPQGGTTTTPASTDTPAAP